MTDNSANLLSAEQKRVVSPQTLAELFNVVAEDMLTTGTGQRIGSRVVAHENQAGIKQHPGRERVTHAELVAVSTALGPVVTHEVHLLSKNAPGGDFEAGTAIFETHEYDKAGQRVGTERTVVGQVDMAGPEMLPFVEQISGLGQN